MLVWENSTFDFCNKVKDIARTFKAVQSQKNFCILFFYVLTPGGIPKADEIGACGALMSWKWWKVVFAILHDSKQLLWWLFYHSAYKKKDKYSIDFIFALVLGGYYIHREVGRECVKSGVSRSDREGWNVWKFVWYLCELKGSIQNIAWKFITKVARKENKTNSLKILKTEPAAFLNTPNFPQVYG